jgi:hypothetical protein
MALNFNLLAQEGPKNLYEGFEQGRQAVAQNALAQQKLAQEGEMMSMRRQEFQSNLESSRAERRRKAAVEKTAMFRDRILRAPTPQAARELVRMQHSDPDLGPVMQQLGSLDQDLADIPDDPTGFERWRQREAMGAAEFIKSQASERGFQDLLARVRGGQQGAAVAPAMPSSAPGAMAAPAELAAGVQPEPMTPVPGVISTSRVPGVTTAPISMPAAAGEGARGIVPAVNTLAPPAAAPVNAMLAAQPAGRGRAPEQIRAEIDQLNMSNMSNDSRVVRMVQTLTKEYEAALRGDQNRPFVVGNRLVSPTGQELYVGQQGTASLPVSIAEFERAKTDPAFMQFLQDRAAAIRPPAAPRQEPPPRTQQVTMSDGTLGIVNMDTGVITPSTVGGAPVKGKPSAFAEKNAAQQKQLGIDINRTIGELEAAAAPGGLIEQSTGSGIGRAVDVGARVFGKAMPGDIAIGKLAPIADMVLKMVPRFEGPQSDKDTKSYKEAAGQLADATLPIKIRQAAAIEIVRLMKARKNQFRTSDMAAEGTLPAAPGASGVDTSNPLLK